MITYRTFNKHKGNSQTARKKESVQWNCVCVYYLVYLLPAILVHTADLCMIVQQQFAAVGVSSNHGAVVERSQTPTVFIVRRCTQVQQCLMEKEEIFTISSLCNENVNQTMNFLSILQGQYNPTIGHSFRERH